MVELARLRASTSTPSRPCSTRTRPRTLADAGRYWERREGARVRVPAGAVVTGGRDVFSSTAD